MLYNLFPCPIALDLYSRMVSGWALICAAIPVHIQFSRSKLVAQAVRIRTGRQN